jgi:hypothetical protein
MRDPIVLIAWFVLATASTALLAILLHAIPL